MASVATRGMNKQLTNSPSQPARKRLVKAAFNAQLGAGLVTKKVSLTPGGDEVTLVALPVFPASPFTAVPEDARFGMQMVYDAATLVAVQAARGRWLPLDIEHNTEGAGTDTRARGWSPALTTAALEPGIGLQPGLMHAWFLLNELGQEAMDGQHYGYTSGVALGYFEDEKTIRFTRVKSLALTNNPGADGMPFLHSVEDADDEDHADADYTSRQAATGAAPTEEKQMLEQIIKALGLSADTTAEAALAAVTALSAAQAASTESVSTLTAKTQADTVALTAAQGQVSTLTAQVADLTTKLTAAKAADVEREVTGAVDAVILDRRANPSQRDDLLAMARSNLTAFQSYAKKLKPLPLGEVTTPAAADATQADSDVLAYVRQATGVDAKTFQLGQAQ